MPPPSNRDPKLRNELLRLSPKRLKGTLVSVADAINDNDGTHAHHKPELVGVLSAVRLKADNTKAVDDIVAFLLHSVDSISNLRGFIHRKMATTLGFVPKHMADSSWNTVMRRVLADSRLEGTNIRKHSEGAPAHTVVGGGRRPALYYTDACDLARLYNRRTAAYDIAIEEEAIKLADIIITALELDEFTVFDVVKVSEYLDEPTIPKFTRRDKGIIRNFIMQHLHVRMPGGKARWEFDGRTKLIRKVN